MGHVEDTFRDQPCGLTLSERKQNLPSEGRLLSRVRLQMTESRLRGGLRGQTILSTTEPAAVASVPGEL